MAGAIAVTSRARWSMRSLEALVALSAGFMIAVALADVLPEAITLGGERAGIVALFGFLLVHLTQHVFARHFHFGEETHEVSKMVSASALLGLLLHTFVDGVAIASGFLVSEKLGILLFTAVALHKIPEGLAVSSLFLAARQGRRAATLAAAVLGMATIAGVALTGEVPWLAQHGLALSAGVMLYVSASNLIPEFQAKRDWTLAISFFCGAAAYLAARSLLRA